MGTDKDNEIVYLFCVLKFSRIRDKETCLVLQFIIEV